MLARADDLARGVASAGAEAALGEAADAAGATGAGATAVVGAGVGTAGTGTATGADAAAGAGAGVGAAVIAVGPLGRPGMAAAAGEACPDGPGMTAGLSAATSMAFSSGARGGFVLTASDGVELSCSQK